MDPDYHFLTRIEEKLINRSPVGAAATIILTVGMIPAALVLIFYYFVQENASSQFILFQGLATLVGIIGPYFLYRYEIVVFPKFIDLAKDVTPHNDNKEIKSIYKRYKSFYSKKYYYVVLPWMIILVATVYINVSYFNRLGVSSFTDPIFVPYLLGVVSMGFITGLGLHMILTTILCIREVGDLNFTIDPLHPDGLGGLSAIGYFAISSTTLFSIGSLGLPLIFDVAGETTLAVLIYFVVFVYIGTVLLSFIYPTLYINRRAKEIRREVLESKRERIYNLHQDILNASSDTNMNRMKTKLDTLRDEYDEYDQINLYPMSPSIFSKLLSSIMLPLFFLLLESYVFG